jgi:hypothetical protein
MPNPFPQVMDNPGQQAPKQKTAGAVRFTVAPFAFIYA